MVYFKTLKEGGTFVRVNSPKRSLKSIIDYYRYLPTRNYDQFVLCFQSGKIYDHIMFKLGYRNKKKEIWRGSIKEGRKRYKVCMAVDSLREETIS